MGSDSAQRKASSRHKSNFEISDDDSDSEKDPFMKLLKGMDGIVWS